MSFVQISSRLAVGCFVVIVAFFFPVVTHAQPNSNASLGISNGASDAVLIAREGGGRRGGGARGGALK